MGSVVSRGLLVLAFGLGVAGCGANYSWHPTAPEGVRTVFVPTFRNESQVMEAGAVASRQLLREFQREGTFRVSTSEDAALEVQGTVVSVSGVDAVYDRRSGLRVASHTIAVSASVSVIDHRQGKIVINNRLYQGVSTYSLYNDQTTGKRDAIGRAADEIARHVVDDVYNLKWDELSKGGSANE